MSFYIEIGAGLDTDDIAHLAEETGIDAARIAATAIDQIDQLEEAAHYAAMDALRDLIRGGA
jgi:hypothetical protein